MYSVAIYLPFQLTLPHSDFVTRMTVSRSLSPTNYDHLAIILICEALKVLFLFKIYFYRKIMCAFVHLKNNLII